MANHFHVSQNGNNMWSGSESRPFRTIQRASDLAIAGDTITVHAGIYREHVSPCRGGASDGERIVYQAAPGEKVVISGAEEITEWKLVQESVYKAVIPNSFFGDFNPYREIAWGDWFISQERVFHLGEVYINGKSLFEVDSLEKVFHPVPYTDAREPQWSLHTWYCETDDENTTIYANFGAFIPEKNMVEINTRKFCFWPEKTGVDYITVRGFHLTMGAPNWAPPTALQEGLIGPHWSKGWVIENNEISNSKNSGISLGKEISTGHNEWTLIGTKQGAQRERDVIFNALRFGWNKETVGSHIVRDNVIHDCEQTGICGHLGAVFSSISGNRIYNIHYKRMFNGAEVAGIKLHAAIDCQIRHNHIYNCDRGIWMDWQTQGTRISGNLLYDNDTEDLFVEVSHGPYVVDNNIFLSMKSIHDLSQGGAYVHNLFGGYTHWCRVTNRFTPYHYAHDTAVHGLMTILGGDNRFFNNIFTGTLPENIEKEKSMDPNIWYHANTVLNENHIAPKGLWVYNECPTSDENWYQGLKSVDEFANVRLPMYCAANLYLNDAKPYRCEKDSSVHSGVTPEIEITHEGEDVYLTLDLGADTSDIKGVTVATGLLGLAFEPEVPFENPDGTPLCVETDFFGNTRPSGEIHIGPFASLEKGRKKLN